jgi:hypothetical protein
MLLHDRQAQLHPALTPLIIAATLHDILSTSLAHTGVIVVQNAAVLWPGKEPDLIRILLSIAPAHIYGTVSRAVIADDYLKRHR